MGLSLGWFLVVAVPIFSIWFIILKINEFKKNKLKEEKRQIILELERGIKRKELVQKYKLYRKEL